MSPIIDKHHDIQNICTETSWLTLNIVILISCEEGSKVPGALGKRSCQVMQKKTACHKDSKSYDPKSLFEIQNTHHWSFQHKCS